MIQKRDDAAFEAIQEVAKKIVAGVVTAPKACGIDDVDAAILTGDDKDVLAEHMRDIARETGEDFYARDAGNVDNSACVILLWAKDDPLQLTNCGLCGFRDCAENRAAGAVCALNITDVGIALGSAVSMAADNRLDNRVMFSAGKGAARMGLFGPEVRVCFGVPLSSKAKSVFFDRGDQDVAF